jgi:hypothetical protein
MPFYVTYHSPDFKDNGCMSSHQILQHIKRYSALLESDLPANHSKSSHRRIGQISMTTARIKLPKQLDFPTRTPETHMIFLKNF